MDKDTPLSQKKCAPCRSGIPALQAKELSKLQSELNGEWKIVNGHHLEKSYTFPDFKTALAFTNKVGSLAEEEGHHPDIHLAWGKVKILLWTHKIDGLTQNDFILAAKCDLLL